ncbi:MAG: hypothetical protein ACRD22_07930 [Terriglobia bacterium]
MSKQTKKRKSGIPTGNAGEYFVMGELLKQGFDAQLADRNTKGYDLLVGSEQDGCLRKVQVKTSRRGRKWFVRNVDFRGKQLDQVTVYVHLGRKDGREPVRYFIAKNRYVKKHIYYPKNFKRHGIVRMEGVERYKDRWSELLT